MKFSRRVEIDPVTNKKYNVIDVDVPQTIWDPNSEFMKELEIHRIKASIKPRKTNMMRSQMGMLPDMYPENDSKKIYLPTSWS